ncbi:MAG: TIM barrel protein [Cellulosilyticaceae bacterium]
MQKLFHMSTIRKYLEWFEDDWEKIGAFVEKHNMAGIELGLTADYDYTKIPEGIVKGVHLSFYPMWLDFWNGDIEILKNILGNEQAIIDYYGDVNRQVMIDSYREQYNKVKALGAEYMVFHVSHVRLEDSFTWKFDYTDEMVIDATIELLNEAFPVEEDGPKLLFENLWWPGLTFERPEIAKRLIDGVKYPNKGFVMDISHLTLMNSEIKNEEDCYKYVKHIVEELGDLSTLIDVVHLNKTLPRNYVKKDHSFLLERYQQAHTKMHKDKILKTHIQRMDPHQPFDHPVADKILQMISPKYCVFETNPSSIYELAHFIIKQNKVLTSENE